MKSWGLDPKNDKDDSHCFNASWVVDLDKKKLLVYRQFDIENGNIMYHYQRTKVWHEENLRS